MKTVPLLGIVIKNTCFFKPSLDQKVFKIWVNNDQNCEKVRGIRIKCVFFFFLWICHKSTNQKSFELFQYCPKSILNFGLSYSKNMITPKNSNKICKKSPHIILQKWVSESNVFSRGQILLRIWVTNDPRLWENIYSEIKTQRLSEANIFNAGKKKSCWGLDLDFRKKSKTG